MPRPRLLFYGMYDPSGQNTAPKVRIARLAAALAEEADVTLIAGGRLARTRRAWGWLLRAGWSSVDAVYVESPTASVLPPDLLFLATARLWRRPVAVYFRDAYQLFRDEYPPAGLRQRLSDVLWRLTMPLLRHLATRQMAPSIGLARALHLREPVLLPPGTDPELPDLGAIRCREPMVGYVGGVAAADGFDLLLEAMALVRVRHPEARLRVVGPPLPGDRAAALPGWVDHRSASRAELPDLLADACLLVIPRPITPYTNLAVPVKLLDYLGFGKPIVATAAEETRAILEPAGAGLVCADTAGDLANAISRVLGDEALSAGLAARARALAVSPEWTWGARARLILESLGLADVRPAGEAIR